MHLSLMVFQIFILSFQDIRIHLANNLTKTGDWHETNGTKKTMHLLLIFRPALCLSKTHTAKVSKICSYQGLPFNIFLRKSHISMAGMVRKWYRLCNTANFTELLPTVSLQNDLPLYWWRKHSSPPHQVGTACVAWVKSKRPLYISYNFLVFCLQFSQIKSYQQCHSKTLWCEIFF